ncbi:GNAT family N-acetyltransferase [Arthrobacter crystallopoietes]|uniref:GNAT family N-acetyltransferase n=1 Tax=Crystallibacter crystallopoietes TaxID=37928 RepID=UPI003D1C6632
MHPDGGRDSSIRSGARPSGAVSYRGRYKARLTALVVDEAERSRGVGALLLEATEQVALDMGAPVLELSTSNQRQQAHRFYERHGYTQPSRHHRESVAPRVSTSPLDRPANDPAAEPAGA